MWATELDAEHEGIADVTSGSDGHRRAALADLTADWLGEVLTCEGARG